MWRRNDRTVEPATPHVEEPEPSRPQPLEVVRLEDFIEGTSRRLRLRDRLIQFINSTLD